MEKLQSGLKLLLMTVEYYNNPTELLNELEIIIGSLKLGNTSPLLLNKGIKII